MAVINDKYKFMFLCEPHTASRATRDALMKLETSRETSTYHHIDVKRALHNHYLTPEQARTYLKFTTIRNPLDLLVTQWFIHSNRRDNFFKFVRGHVKAMRDGTLFWRFLDDVQHFVRYEKLEEGVNTIMAAVKAPHVEFKVDPSHVTPGKTKWQDEWCQRYIDWALDHYPDIKRYGYEPGFDLDELAPIIEPHTD